MSLLVFLLVLSYQLGKLSLIVVAGNNSSRAFLKLQRFVVVVYLKLSYPLFPTLTLLDLQVLKLNVSVDDVHVAKQ